MQPQARPHPQPPEAVRGRGPLLHPMMVILGFGLPEVREVHFAFKSPGLLPHRLLQQL